MLASSCRQKIIKELSKVKGIHIMGLVRRINSTYNETNRNFKILQKEGIVTDRHFGRMRVIKLNRENPRTGILLQVLETLESENSVAALQWKRFHFLIDLQICTEYDISELFLKHFVFLKNLKQEIRGSASLNRGTRIMNLEIPATTIFHKNLKPLRENGFIATFEYGWSKAWEAVNGQVCKPQETSGSDLDLQDNCFSATISFPFQSSRKEICDDITWLDLSHLRKFSKAEQVPELSQEKNSQLQMLKLWQLRFKPTIWKNMSMHIYSIFSCEWTAQKPW